MEIKRDIHLRKLIDSKHNGMIKVVTGMRRCGKSYLLFNLFCQHLKEEGIEDDHIIKVDLENRRNKALRDPDALLHYIDSRMTDKQMYYILLDEIQYVNEFEDVLNSYLSIENADVYVTGSNSKFLSKDVISFLDSSSTLVEDVCQALQSFIRCLALLDFQICLIVIRKRFVRVVGIHQVHVGLSEESLKGKERSMVIADLHQYGCFLSWTNDDVSVSQTLNTDSYLTSQP